jgi:integrase/recombinase XerD
VGITTNHHQRGTIMKTSEALELFLVAQKAAGNSPRTYSWYRDQVGVFIAYAGDPPLSDLTAVQIRSFLAEQFLVVKPSTVAARWRGLSAFCNWLVAEEILARSPLARIPKPQVPEEEPRRATLQDIEQLIDSIPDATWVDLRDRLIVRLLFWTGLRLEEFTALRIEDMDLNGMQLVVRRGKNGKARPVPFPQVLRSQIAEYLLNRPAEAAGPLWLSSWGDGSLRGALTPNGLASAIRRRCRHAGMQAINPHAFRHGMAMALLKDGGVELGIVSKILGHASPEITRAVYADWMTGTVQRAYREAIRRMSQ